LELAIEQPLAKAQADVAAIHAGAAGKLIEQLADVDFGTFFLPPLLLVKRLDEGGRVHLFARTLSARQVAVLERHQDALERPPELLALLSMAHSDLQSNEPRP
jgi:hypothetical protein